MICVLSHTLEYRRCFSIQYWMIRFDFWFSFNDTWNVSSAIHSFLAYIDLHGTRFLWIRRVLFHCTISQTFQFNTVNKSSPRLSLYVCMCSSRQANRHLNLSKPNNSNSCTYNRFIPKQILKTFIWTWHHWTGQF